MPKNHKKVGTDKIDLGLKQLLQALEEDTATTNLQSNSNEAEETQEAKEIQEQVNEAITFTSILAKQNYEELENFALQQLDNGQYWEAKLWWIRSVALQKKLPSFLLKGPLEEALSQIPNESELQAEQVELIAAVKKLVSSKESAELASENKKTPEKTASTPINIEESSIENLANKSDFLAHSERKKNNLQFYVLGSLSVFFLIAAGFFANHFFQSQQTEQLAIEYSLKSNSVESQANTLAATENNIKSSESSEDVAGSDFEKSRAIFEKLKEQSSNTDLDQEQEFEEASAEGEDLQNKQKPIGMKDILQMVNEAPAPKFEQRIREEKRKTSQQQGEIAKIKSELKIESSLPKKNIDLSGPEEPEFIAKILQNPEYTTSIELTGTKELPIIANANLAQRSVAIPYTGKARPAIITKTGSVYTNTSPYGVEIDILQPGDEVWILENQGIWLKIASKQGEVGFIDAQLIS